MLVKTATAQCKALALLLKQLLCVRHHVIEYETGNMVIYLRHFRAYKRHNSVTSMIIHLLVMDRHHRTVTEMLDNDNFPYRRLSIGLCPEWLALPKSECMTWDHINAQKCYVLNGSQGLILKFF